LQKGESPTLLSNLDFGRKAFKHRKFQPILALIGLAICVASTIFLVLLGQGLELIFAPSSNGRIANFLSGTISRFIYFDSALIFIIGMLLILFLFSSMMADRKHDASLIKALGSTKDVGFSYVMSEPLLIIIYGCLLGGLVGSVAFVAYSVAFLPFALYPQGVIYVFIILGLLIMSFAVSWFIAGHEAEKMFKIASINLFSGDIQNFDFVKEQLVGFRRFLGKLPWAFQVVVKSMIRSRSKSKIAVICLMLSIVLMTVSFAGGAVEWSTTRNYVDNSFGQNIIAVGNKQVIDEYTALMTTNLNAQSSSLLAFNFLEPQFYINSTFIEKLNSTQGVITVDSRLLMFTRVEEVQTFAIVDGSYVSYGDTVPRSSSSLIVGVDPDYVVDNLLTQKEVLNSSNSSTTVIGSSLAETIFDSPLKQKIEIFSKDSSTNQVLAIANVTLDPLNRGFVVYMPLDVLQKLNSINGQNLILVKVQNDSATSEIAILAAQYGLAVVNLDKVHQQVLSNVDGIWLSILAFPLLSVITTLIGLLNCMFVSFSGRQHDFGILKAMGANPNYIAKIVLLESFTLILLTAPVGITIGMLFNLVFLLPNATISLHLFIATIGGLSLLLLSMCGLSTIIMLKMNKQSPKNLMQETE
jgi:ABC-type antimicrobial peptide transport system permease subunit